MSPKLLLPIVIMTILSACAGGVGHYIPEVQIDSDAVQSYSNTGAIRLENQSPSGLRDLDFREIQVDLNEVTQSLITAISEELSRRGSTVQDGATKTITLDMKGIVVEPEGGGFTFASTVFVDVTLGGTESFFVEAKRSSYASGFNVSGRPTKPLDAALSDAAVLILNDPRFREFVERGD